MFCRNCGGFVEDTALFCTNCGEKLNQTTTFSATAEPVNIVDPANTDESVNTTVEAENTAQAKGLFIKCLKRKTVLITCASLLAVVTLLAIIIGGSPSARNQKRIVGEWVGTSMQRNGMQPESITPGFCSCTISSDGSAVFSAFDMDDLEFYLKYNPEMTEDQSAGTDSTTYLYDLTFTKNSNSPVAGFALLSDGVLGICFSSELTILFEEY